MPRFIPLREPWRNGVVEHFNDVWDKAFFRTRRGASPDELRQGLDLLVPVAGYTPPLTLPRRGRIEVVRFIP